VNTVPTPVPTPYASATSNPAFSDWDSGTSQRGFRDKLPFAGLGGLIVPAAIAFGVWWYLRRRREQNKPINRLRRQAAHTAAEIREHVPSGDELTQPIVGVVAALASTALMVWRQMRQQRASRMMRRAGATISDADWQKRLSDLKERWHPGRVELEKFQISRH
jgi:hypothetical protein